MGTPLDGVTRCSCFQAVSPSDAQTAKCKSNDQQELTLAEEYAKCVAAGITATSSPAVCTQEQLQAPLQQMTTKCQNTLQTAIESNAPLTQPQRCRCYEQVDTSVALSMSCKTM